MARNLMSAVSASRCSAAPPSIATDTLADRRDANGAAASAFRNDAASACASTMSVVGQSGQRIGQHRNAVARLDAERCHVRGEQRRRRRAQAADLDAAARGDLDDAVAVRPRRGAKASEGVERDRRSGGRQAREQTVAGRHRRGEPGTSAAAHRYGRVHAAASARTDARLASMSFRRGCHRPSRRAMSSRSAMARAAAGFSSIRKSRTSASPR